MIWKISLLLVCSLAYFPHRSRAQDGCADEFAEDKFEPIVLQKWILSQQVEWIREAARHLSFEYIRQNGASLLALSRLGADGTYRHIKSDPLNFQAKKLIPLAKIYGPDLEFLLDIFKERIFEVEPNIRNDLLKIKSLVKTRFFERLSYLPKEVLEHEMTDVVNAVERYGSNVDGLFVAFRKSFFILERKYRNVLMEIHQYSGDSSSLFASLTPTLLETGGAELVQVARLIGGRAAKVHEKMDADNLDVVVSLVQFFGSSAAGLLAKADFRKALEPENLEKLKAIHTSFRDADFSFDEATEIFSPQKLVLLGDQLIELGQINPYASYGNFIAAKHFLLKIGGDDLSFLIRLARFADNNLLGLVANLDKVVLAEHQSYLIRLAEIGTDLDRVSKALNKVLEKDNEEDLLTIARRYPHSFRGLLEVFGRNFYELTMQHQSEIDHIEENLGMNASDFCKILPIHLWSDPSVRQAIAFYREDSLDMFRISTSYGIHRIKFDWIKSMHTPLLQINRSVFGIVQFSKFAEFSKSGVRFPILEDNIHYLSPTYENPEKPIALVVFGHDDWNGAVRKGIARSSSTLSKRYRTFVAEVDSKEQITEHLQRASSLFGTDKSGLPRRPVSLLIINAHANSRLIALGHRDPSESTSEADLVTPCAACIGVNDHMLYKQWAEYLSDDSGTILLAGCKTGAIHPSGESLLFSLSEALPQ